MGDIILAAKSAYFLQAFRRIGLVPDCGSTWMLPRLVGKSRAVELSLLGERLPAEKALEWGLINRVVEDAELAAETKKLADDLANGPTVAMAHDPHALLGKPAQLVRGAARSRSADARKAHGSPKITAKASRRSWKSARRSSRGGRASRSLARQKPFEERRRYRLAYGGEVQ